MTKTRKMKKQYQKIKGGNVSELNIINKLNGIISSGVNINKYDTNGDTPLFISIKYGFIDIIDKLLKAGADSNKLSSYGMSPLNQAITNNNSTIVEMLLKYDANTNITSPCQKHYHNELEPLLFAIIENNLNIIKLLVQYGAQINYINDNIHKTPLIFAIENRRTYYYNELIDTSVIEFLLKVGADTNTPDKQGDTPLHHIIRGGHLLDIPIIELLFRYGAERNIKNAKGETPLDIANSFSIRIRGKPNERREIFINLLSSTRDIILPQYADVNALLLAQYKSKKDYNVNHMDNILIISSTSTIMPINNNIKAIIIKKIGLTHIPELPSQLMFLDCSDNPIQTLPKLPPTLRTLICVNCKLNNLCELPNSLNYLDVRNNNLKDIYKLPKNINIFNLNSILSGNPLPVGFFNKIGPIGKYSKKRIHQTIEFNNNFINTTIIPKGTLLFRNVNKYMEEEIKGIKNNNNYYMYPHFNVFFYPYPFVGDSYIKTNKLVIFETLRDIEIIMAIAPSNNKRANRFNEEYLVSCDKIQNAKISGHPYDPCFVPSFASKYPEISGIMGIASMDVNYMLKGNKDQIYFTKYRSNVLDENDNIGVAEIILHPLENRFDNLSKNNYKVHKILNHNVFEYDEAWKYVENAICSNSIWTIDLATRMFVNYNSVSDEIKQRCIPIEEPFKLHYLNDSYNI